MSQYDDYWTPSLSYRLWYCLAYSLFTFTLTIPQNAFATKLQKFKFDHFLMLVVDIMHEFELGTWKAVFSHLIRVLYAISPSGNLVAQLDER